MARSTMEAIFLGTQKLEFSSKDGPVKMVKLFYAEEPDGVTENGLCIISMQVVDEVADEVFVAGADIVPLEKFRITFEVERGGKQQGSNRCLHIEPLKPKADKPATPAQSPNTQAKA